MTGAASGSRTVRRSNSGPLNSLAVSTNSLSITFAAGIGVGHQLCQLDELGVQFVRFGLQLDDVELGEPPKLQRQNVISLLLVDREAILQAAAGIVDGIGVTDHRDRGVDVQVNGHQTGDQVPAAR